MSRKQRYTNYSKYHDQETVAEKTTDDISLTDTEQPSISDEPSSDSAAVSTEPEKYVTIVSKLNVRKGPGKEHEAIHILEEIGTEVQVHEVVENDSGDWGKTDEGYICLYDAKQDRIFAREEK